MCSLAGEVMLKENIENLSGKNLELEKCKKCLIEKPAILLRKKDAYCKSCFLQATTHKFRAAIGKYRISNKERVLIVYRVGHPSTALLHFIKMGLEQTHHKKLRLVPVFLYIDDHYKLRTEERLALCKLVLEQISFHKFSIYFSVLNSNINDDCDYLEFRDEAQYEQIKEMLESARKDFSETKYDIDICRRNIVINVAKKLSCKYAFTTETNGDVAVKILSGVANGRGSQLTLEAGECDNRDPNVTIIQPLRYFETKELAFYNIFNGISSISVPIHNYKELHSSNINKLLSKFVYNLQENYPSTANTVVRTGDKLACNKTDSICRVCKAPVEFQDELSSSEASKFSRWISANVRHSEQNISSFVIDCDNTLCYACERSENKLN